MYSFGYRRIWVGYATVAVLSVGLMSCSAPSGNVPVKAIYSSTEKRSLPIVRGYLVQEGDTLHAIAFRSGQDARVVAEINQLKPPYTLRSGMTIYLDTIGDYQDQYQVRLHDSLSLIASRFSVSLEHLAKINGIQPPYMIYPGQTLFINGSKLSAAHLAEDASGLSQKQDTGLTSIAKSKKTVERRLKKEYAQKVVQKNNKLDKQRAIVWRWPTQGRLIAESQRIGSSNKAIRIGGQKGQAIVAAADGQVVYAGNALQGYGQLLILKHDEDYLSAYAHNQRLLVRERQFVKSGQRIALMGKNDASAVQLHFEIRYRGKSVDPRRYLPNR